MRKEKLYHLPEYYDIAFSWDISKEIEFLVDLFKRHVPFEVKNILEPACGTGRFLVNLPKYGYHMLGYDNSPKMVAYAKKRIADTGLQKMSTVIVDDMKSAKFDKKFDAAINLINSIGYLLSDDDILTHLRNTGESLRSEGIYVVQLACAWDKLEPHEEEGWIMERNGIRVKTIWDIEKEDKEKKLSYQVCKMEIDDHGKHILIEDHHTLRLWLFEDLKSLIRRSEKFELEAIYDEKHKQISLNSHKVGRRKPTLKGGRNVPLTPPFNNDILKLRWNLPKQLRL